MMIAVLQPSYLPWLGYFDQIDRADQFVFYDDVQYDKNGWRNRNRIRTDSGSQWLTVPCRLKGRFGARINDVEITPDDPWRRKHLKSIEQWYRGAPFYESYRPFIEELYGRDWPKLSELAIYGIKEIARRLDIQTSFHLASALGVSGDRVQRLLNLCAHFGATEYLTGDAAADYLDEEAFAQQQVRIVYQKYEHPVYPQQFEPFVPHLSIIDLMFNAGPESLSVLRSRR